MAYDGSGGGSTRREALSTRARQRDPGKIDASGFKLGIVVGDYHASLGEALLSGALARLKAGGTEPARVLRVPGAFEIPQAVARLLDRCEPPLDAVIALGVLLRGETLHFDILAYEVCSSLQSIGLATGVPVTFGVLTVDSERQARDRAGRGRANKGWEAADAALRMADLFRRIEEPIVQRPSRSSRKRRRS